MAANDDAYTMIDSLLKGWGLESLGSVVRQMLVDGDSAEVVPIKLRETGQYKQRFAGNIARQKAGLPALSEAEYLSTETALKTVVRRYVGRGQFDTQDMLNKWMTADVSAQELNTRFQQYDAQYGSLSVQEKDAWAKAGLSYHQAIAAIADPSLTETDLKTRFNRMGVGTSALRVYGEQEFRDGLSRFNQYADQGVDAATATAGFGAVKARQENEGFLAHLAGTTLTTAEQEKDAVLKDATVGAKRDAVLNAEKDRFAENTKGGTTALGKDVTGSY
jgi:hypothetical protein